MENVERARKKRRTTRGLVTKLLTKIEESLEQDRIEIDCRKLKQFQADLKEKAECLKEIDGTILDGLIDVDADDDTCENEAAEANEIQEKIRFNLICLEEALESIGMKRSTSQESRRTNNGLALGDKARRQQQRVLFSLGRRGTRRISVSSA
eukprot:gene14741-5847_t